MAILNNTNMFTSVEMTDAVNKLPTVSYRFSGMFEEQGVRTTHVALELEKNRITLIGDSPRGSAPEYVGAGKREIKMINTCHLAQADVLTPEDLQDVRAFGSTELATAATVVNDKMQILKRNVEMTREMHRLGAVKGVVMDADGKTELLNLFDLFGVTQKKETITFPTGTLSADNPISTAILKAKRACERAMGGNPYSHIECIVGENFYDKLTGHAIVRQYFEDWLAHRPTFGENDYRRYGFTYCGVTFFECSDVIGGLQQVKADYGHLYPVGPGIWKAWNAPADWMETVNTIGLPYYARMDERPQGRGFDIEVQANPLTMCIFPEALIELKAV